MRGKLVFQERRRHRRVISAKTRQNIRKGRPRGYSLVRVSDGIGRGNDKTSQELVDRNVGLRWRARVGRMVSKVQPRADASPVMLE